MNRRAVLFGQLASLALASPAMAQMHTPPMDPKQVYSPYPEQNFPNTVYFGDTHLHTSYSVDAGMAGNKVGPEDAYRFALGYEVTSSTGLRAKLKRPLDFLVIADHAENLGLAPLIEKSDPTVLNNPQGKRYYDMVKAGKGYDAFIDWLSYQGRAEDPIKDPTMARTGWNEILDMAEKYNQPGRFTAIIGFEWTTNIEGNNLHRNVLFRGSKKTASTIVPYSQYDSRDPEDLWAWMAAYEKNTGDKLLAIPHNGNLSNGMMFAETTLTTKKPLDADYATRRSAWEPVVEIIQPKGSGEAHPFLSPNDEFANFALIDGTNLNGTAPKTKDMYQYEYAREALKRGLAYEDKLGTNPFKFGMIGSTDAHGGLASSEENNWFGKANIVEPSPERWKDVLIKSPVDDKLSITALKLNASGLAAVWARENTREALWDAFKRREVYATSGTRIRVRVFGGFDFDQKDLYNSNFAEQGYARGVPMGGDLSGAPAGKAPGFVVRAIRDPDGANLDRIQVIKGWVDADGKTHERIYDVAVSGNRTIGADGRARQPVGNSVNVDEASYDNSIGAATLGGFWKDPEFNPGQRAFYYFRVIEIPTPTFLAYDRKFYELKDVMPKDATYFSQERAVTSPIWYTP